MDNLNLLGKLLSARLGLVVVGLAYCIYRFLKRRGEHRENELIAQRHGCLPVKAVYPCRLPLGIDVLKAQYKANAEQRLLAFQQPHIDKLGETFEIKILGTPGYTTLDPENIEAVLSSHFEDYNLGTRRGAMFPFLGEGIFTQDDEPWKHSRELLRRPFLKSHYQNLRGFLGPIDRIIAKLPRSGVVDLQPLFFQFTLATTTALLFGRPTDGLENDEQKVFARSFNHASLVSNLRMRLVDFYWAYQPRSYVQACREVKAYADDIVQRTLREQRESTSEKLPEDYGFIHDLYAEMQDTLLVRDQLVNVLLAGRDTTACLLSWVFFSLVRHPKVLARLREEIDSIVGRNTELARGHIQKMTYLRCILNETLRLYPPIPINVRFAKKTTVLPRGGGSDGRSPLLIKRGLGVGLVSYYLHRRKDVYGDDAMEYRPERWEESGLQDAGWAYVPFHGGPRLCLGKDFALMEASCAVVRILQEFPSLKLAPGTTVSPIGEEKQELTVFLKPAEGCKILLG